MSHQRLASVSEDSVMHMRSLSNSWSGLAATFRGFSRASAEELEPRFPRLVERNLPYHQSENNVNIRNRNARRSLYLLLQYNWFHVFLNINTRISVLILLVVWTAMILFFALLYYWVDTANPGLDCGLANVNEEKAISYHGAFGFSLETATTVGYSLPGSSNALFENCAGVTTVIYFQMMLSMLYNAFLFAFFFARLAKSESRAIQVVFSEKCVVRETERGTLVWQVRVYDVDSGHGIVEAHVRLYALLKHKDSEGHPRMEQLRIVSPNDDLGAVLFLNIPTIVTHEVDYYSPLYSNDTYQHDADAKFRLSSGGLLLREVDSVTGNREEIMCPVCGETYGDFRRLHKHIKYNQMTEKKDDIPIQGSHRELDLAHIPRKPSRPSLRHIRETLPLQELIVVVEGIDPLTSGTFQALHSYMPEDIEWNACFVPCITSTTSLDATFVDLELFHHTKPHLLNRSGGSSSNDPFASAEGENEKFFDGLRKDHKYGTIVQPV